MNVPSEMPFPSDEAARLVALRRLRVLDTPPEERFDRITRTAARLFDVPIAVVSLVDADRQWFKSCLGLEVTETPRNVAFCAYAILAPGALVVPDAAADPRFADNPLVIGEPFIRFYAGHPLIDEGGHALGTLCVIDRRPRTFDHAERAALADLATMVQLELAQQARGARGEAIERELNAARDHATDLWQQAWRAHRQLLEGVRQRDEFLMAINHELRTPLAAVVGAADILAQRLGAQATPEAPFARMVVAQAGVMQRLLEDLLAYQQLATGQLGLARDRLDLGELAAQATLAAQDRAEAGAILLACPRPAAEAVVLGDGPRILAALDRLLANAIKFSPREATVTVCVAGDGDHAEVAVSDTGPGIPEEDHERIFEPFVQLDGGATRRHGGVGLGLTFARRLVEELGGRITLASSPGHGSTFTIRLPLAPPAAKP